jgi:hypothetical protein
VRAEGAALLIVVVTILIMTGLVWMVHVQVLTELRLVTEVESQLYSFILAENGVEYAKSILPHLDLHELLVGSDGVPCTAPRNELRDPMDFSAARRCDPLDWVPSCDDGLPPAALGLTSGRYQAESGGFFLLRFSNDPADETVGDTNQVVIVRSLGIVPLRVSNPALSEVKNQVSLIEAELRQETAFRLPSPLTVLAQSGQFLFEGDEFVIDGGESSAVAFAFAGGSGIQQDFTAAVSEEQSRCFPGAGSDPSWSNVSGKYASELPYSRLFTGAFWESFETRLPEFAQIVDGLQNEETGLVLLPGGGVVEGKLAGILVAKGDVVLTGETEIRGLLLHLGAGMLRLEGSARVLGGIWLSNIDPSGNPIRCRGVTLQISDKASVRFDQEAVGKALGWFPPTQLGWRIIFPEMER